jgi:hypothetical protein
VSRERGARSASSGSIWTHCSWPTVLCPTNLPGFYPAVYPKRACNAPGLPLSDLPPAREQAGTLEAHFQNDTLQTACRNRARTCERVQLTVVTRKTVCGRIPPSA